MRAAIEYRYTNHRSNACGSLRTGKADCCVATTAQARTKTRTVVTECGLVSEVRRLSACCSICFTEFSYDRRVEFVFEDLNPSVHGLRSVVRQNFYLSLCKDLPVINFLIDVMHCAPGHPFTSGEGLLPRCKAWKLRQE